MNNVSAPDAYGVLIEPTTLKLERLLPGPIERVWEYVTKSDLRRQWLAAGDMDLNVGAPFELTWRHNEITNPAGKRPDDVPEEHSMQSHIVEIDPPHKLVFAWKNSGDVSIELAQHDDEVLLTLIHRRLPDRETMQWVATGWHLHLDMLVVRLNNTPPPRPFWDGFDELLAAYDKRLPAEVTG